MMGMEGERVVDLKVHWKGREGGSRKVRRLSVKRMKGGEVGRSYRALER